MTACTLRSFTNTHSLSPLPPCLPACLPYCVYMQMYLPPDQMLDVFTRIFSLLSRRVPGHFSEVMPSTQTGKQRIIDEAVHLVHTLSGLKFISTETLTIEDTLRKRYAVTFSSGSAAIATTATAAATTTTTASS